MSSHGCAIQRRISWKVSTHSLLCILCMSDMSPTHTPDFSSLFSLLHFPCCISEEDDIAINGGILLNEQDCSSLLKKIMKGGGAAITGASSFKHELPLECNRFDSLVYNSSSSNDNNNDDDTLAAFVGMDPGSAIKAMSARDHGHPHSAQITRRLTTRSKPTESSWF
jgi:hypothetical protein